MMFPLLLPALPASWAPAPAILRFAPDQPLRLSFSALSRSVTPAPRVYPLLFTHRSRSGPASQMQTFYALPGFVTMAQYFIRLRRAFGATRKDGLPARRALLI
jgi:hypothetical protein